MDALVIFEDTLNISGDDLVLSEDALGNSMDVRVCSMDIRSDSMNAHNGWMNDLSDTPPWAASRSPGGGISGLAFGGDSLKNQLCPTTSQASENCAKRGCKISAA